VIATLLGDAEGPAHTEWRESADRLRERYVKAPSRLRYVRHAISQIGRAILFGSEKADRNLLADVFSARKPTKRTPPTPHDLPAPRPSPFSITRLEGGFHLKCRQKPADGMVSIQVAYDLPRGNPFKHYDTGDFDFANAGEITISCQGARLALQQRNQLRLVPLGDPDHDTMDLVATGFDPNRDIIVRAHSETSTGLGEGAP
jgi:hypothetical protein